MNSIEEAFSSIGTNRQINSIIIFLERKTGLKRDTLIYCNVHDCIFEMILFSVYSDILATLVVYLIFGWKSDVFCNIIVFLIPIYAS